MRTVSIVQTIIISWCKKVNTGNQGVADPKNLFPKKGKLAISVEQIATFKDMSVHSAQNSIKKVAPHLLLVRNCKISRSEQEN